MERDALPLPGNERPDLEQAYVAPKTALQKYLAKLWCQSLNLEKVGIHDRYFELGGNSLQAAGFISQLQNLLGETIFIVSIFDKPTIAEYATFLEQNYTEAIRRHFGTEFPTIATASISQLQKEDFEQFNTYIPTSKFPIDVSATKNNPAIFILAPPRSGTTLLRVMLAGHPDLFAANELQLLHFDNLQERSAAYQGKFSLWAEGLIRTVMELQSCDADKARMLIQQYQDQGYTTQQMYHQLQAWLGKQMLVDKSPSYALDAVALNRAEQLFDGALYIHLLRHPYAMIRSFERMHMDQVMHLKPHSYNSRQLGELIWTKSHETITSFLIQIPADRQFRLNYEDLVQEPGKMMRALCTQLGISYQPQLIRPYDQLDRKMTDGLYADSKPMGDIRLLEHKGIDPTLADTWKGVKKDNFLNTTTWQLAEKLGYDPLPITPSTAPNKNTSVPISDSHSSQDIAIIGMSARLPCADTLEAFWHNLSNGIDVSSTFTDEQLRVAGISEEAINDPDYVRRGMSLRDYDCFDAGFFGYTPKEAALMDPQHRIYLECAWAALEDAGYDAARYAGSIGVMGGVARNTYLVNNVLTHPQYFNTIEDFTKGITQEKDFPATRVAYKLNLKGPAVNIQTACSSSGVAVHLACQSLLSGDADMMLVGGGRIQPPVEAGHLHTDGHALSPDGYWPHLRC